MCQDWAIISAHYYLFLLNYDERMPGRRIKTEGFLFVESIFWAGNSLLRALELGREGPSLPCWHAARSIFFFLFRKNGGIRVARFSPSHGGQGELAGPSHGGMGTTATWTAKRGFCWTPRSRKMAKRIRVAVLANPELQLPENPCCQARNGT